MYNNDDAGGSRYWTYLDGEARRFLSNRKVTVVNIKDGDGWAFHFSAVEVFFHDGDYLYGGRGYFENGDEVCRESEYPALVDYVNERRWGKVLPEGHVNIKELKGLGF